jgi:hypothetical protein
VSSTLSSTEVSDSESSKYVCDDAMYDSRPSTKRLPGPNKKRTAHALYSIKQLQRDIHVSLNKIARSCVRVRAGSEYKSA